jgi:RNA polymerase sigma-70 factor (ECF subfamily)
MAEPPMLDCPPESNTLLDTSVSEAQAASPLAVEEKMVRLFDEVRVPLLRYLSAFPLAIPDGEDVIQEAFLALFQQLQRGKSHHYIRGWLFRAAHNLAIKKTVRSRNDTERTGSLIAVEELVIDPALNPEDQFAFNQTQKRLMSVVRALPQQQRWRLYLRAEGLRYREIAEVLDMSLGAVSLSLERSLAHIARAAERVQSHLAACWACRARKQEMETTIGEFMRFQREIFNHRFPPSDGPQALLKAQMAQLGST